MSENTKNERTAQMVEHHPSSERHMNIPVLQIESSDVRCQQNRVLQTVPLKVSTSHSSREKSQSNKYQVM